MLGGLDLHRTIESGVPVASDGLLARADGGYLCVQDANLLDCTLSCEIVRALDTGDVLLERDGLSVRYASGFSLLACYNPEEGPVEPSIAECAGLHVASACAEDRAEVLRRLDFWSRDTRGFTAHYRQETAHLRTSIAEARNRLPGVGIGVEQLEALALAAVTLQVEGHRADVFAVRAARARASLNGRGGGRGR